MMFTLSVFYTDALDIRSQTLQLPDNILVPAVNMMQIANSSCALRYQSGQDHGGAGPQV
jgi:hypothetical protein